MENVCKIHIIYMYTQQAILLHNKSLNVLSHFEYIFVQILYDINQKKKCFFLKIGMIFVITIYKKERECILRKHFFSSEFYITIGNN